MSLDRLCIKLFGIANKVGILKYAPFERMFVAAYFLYKRHFECPFRNLASRYPRLFDGGHILDVGANIGYTSLVFADHLSPGFKVFAFEPEHKNFTLLCRLIEHRGLQQQLRAIEAAVGARDGQAELWRNQGHHADHRIVTDRFRDTIPQGAEIVSTPMMSIDSFIKQNCPAEPITFIKIDVQGYELSVCQGMKKTLEENENVTITVEYDPAGMQELGFDAQELLKFFEDRKFLLYLLDRRGIGVRICSSDNLGEHFDGKGYIDLIASRRPVNA